MGVRVSVLIFAKKEESHTIILKVRSFYSYIHTMIPLQGQNVGSLEIIRHLEIKKFFVLHVRTYRQTFRRFFVGVSKISEKNR